MSMLKGVTLPPTLYSSNALNSYSPVHAYSNDNANFQNRAYIGPSVDSVSFLVNWFDVQCAANGGTPITQTNRPSDLYGSWNQLNRVEAQRAFALLDRQIKAANDDGKIVILSCYHGFPDWARKNSAGTLQVDGPRRTDQGDNTCYPFDRGPNSPWGWFLSYLFARYIFGAPINASGPNASAQTGNPLGAYVSIIQPFNEPNLTWWPHASYGSSGNGSILDLHWALGQMAQTAGTIADYYKTFPAPYVAPYLVIPGTSDAPEASGANFPSGGPYRWTPWLIFTENLLSALVALGFAPSTRVAWSHHNYRDVAYGANQSGNIYRVQNVWSRLNNWRDRNYGIYLTEGGYQIKTATAGNVSYPSGAVYNSAYTDFRYEQLLCMYYTHANMRTLGYVAAFHQYLLHDTWVPFQSSIRGTVTPNYTQPNQAPYYLYSYYPSAYYFPKANQ